MAEGIVEFFLTKLSDLLLLEASKLRGAEGQLRHLQSELRWMRLVLKDRDADPDRGKSDERFQLFATEVRDITFAAEDVVDEFVFKLNRHSQRRQRFAGIMAGCLCFAPKSVILHDLDAQIRDINERTEKNFSNKSRYGIENVPSNLDASSSSYNNSALPVKERRVRVVEEVNVIGVKDDTESVKRMLLHGDQRRAVVSIVGMGGLGKTTVAKNIYNCSDIKQHFCCHAMVCVSQDYRAKHVLFEIAKGVMTVTGEEKIKELEKMEVRELRSRILPFLNGRKYLIVMDDLWSTEAWDDLHSCFPDSNDGSRILITTRNEDLARHADPQSVPHILRFLNLVESWDLFVWKVFLTRNYSTTVCPPELEELGRKIVEKCGGLPLAIVVLGGLLSKKERTQNSWRRVLDSMNWHLGQGLNSCWEILALSYNDLPYYLKSCFLYCGLFPEDHEIKASKLMHMWVAEGFIQSRGKGTTLEVIAEDYFEELLHRNMIQGARRRSDGGVKTWRIHDLLRDLAIAKAREPKLFYIHEPYHFTSPDVIRRLIIHDSLSTRMIHQNSGNLKLRSLICCSKYFENKSWMFLRGGLKLLTVLDLEGAAGIRALPKEIGELIHLKFLDLKRTGIRRLPRSIGKLANLQTLDLRNPFMAIKPAKISELQQLRHLYGCRWFPTDLNTDSFDFEQLVSLQTFHITLGKRLGDGGGLGKLTQLRKLRIVGKLWKHGGVVLSESIHKLIGLRSLCLVGVFESRGPATYGIPNLKPFTNHVELCKVMLYGRLEPLPAAIEFYPPNLTKLVLEWSELREDPMSTLEKLPSLRRLQLGPEAYVGKKMCCSPGGFPKLHSLTLRHLKSVEEWDVNDGALPFLGYLEMVYCSKMTRLPNGLLRLRNLTELKLNGPTLELEDHVKQLKGEDWDKNQPSIVVVSRRGNLCGFED